MHDPTAHGGQQLAFWNAHHDERGFASMHIYHVASGTPVAAILRPARSPKGLLRGGTALVHEGHRFGSWAHVTGVEVLDTIARVLD
jgi:hypothetical protein